MAEVGGTVTGVVEEGLRSTGTVVVATTVIDEVTEVSGREGMSTGSVEVVVTGKGVGTSAGTSSARTRSGENTNGMLKSIASRGL
jgi:hypothetical protein